MITDQLYHTEIQAVNRLRNVWVPSKVVLEAILAWLDRAKLDGHGDDGIRALRWCKWQRIKCLQDPSAQSLFEDQYQRCFRFLKSRSLVDERISNSPFEISESDLSELSNDVEAMEEFLAAYLPTDGNIEDVRNGGTSYCERHLWGPFDHDTAGIQVHFWPIQDCFKPSAQK